MKICAVTGRCVALMLDKAAPIDSDSAQSLVRRVLEQRNMPVWNAMYIDVFTGNDRSMLLARPETISRVSIAPYALPWFMDYFTE